MLALDGEGTQLCGELILLGVELGWVHQANRAVQSEVDKLEEGHVELDKGAHDSEVDIANDALVELVGDEPEDVLALNGGLVVDTLDGQERLAQALRDDQVVLELEG